MNRIIILAFTIIALVGVIFAVIISLPQKQTPCQSNDGLCPQQCSYESDKDCLKSRTTTLGEIKRCLSDRDCIAVKPFCGNPTCTFTDNECTSNKFCSTAISKDYVVTWSTGRVKCLQPIETTCEPIENFQTKCVVGTCKVVGNT